MYLRLAFAVAAHLEPEILIVDEVLAVGDEAFQRKCLGQMQSLAGGGRTVLFVSHNLTAVRRLCSFCYVLDGGKLVYQGEPTAAVSHYLDMAASSEQPSSFEYQQEGCHIVVTTRDQYGRPSMIWRYGEPLHVEIKFQVNRPLTKPAVDIAFYTGVNTKLFAFQSDRLQPVAPQARDTYQIVFSVENPGVTVPEIFFDVGLREGFAPYFAKVKGAGRLFPDYSTTPFYIVPDSLLTPRATLEWQTLEEFDELPSAVSE
jgi:hypothetical protein